MSGPEDADAWFARHGLAEVRRISDPDRRLYAAFGLRQGTFAELTHPRVWWPWLRTAILHGRGAGPPDPHWRQLTGVFLIHHGTLRAALRHRNSAARPGYLAIVRSAGST
jgi:hypothetical protein